MNIANRNEWKKALDRRAEEARKAKREKEHPLAAMKEDRTPENVLHAPKTEEAPAPATEQPQASTPLLSEDVGLGGGVRDEGFTLPSDTKAEGEEVRAAMKEEADKRLEAGSAEREAANQKSEELFAALAAFAEKQDKRYDELLQLVQENDYKNAPGTEELLYSYLRGAETVAADSAASLAGENGGNGDSYSVAMAARAQKEHAAKGEAAARDYYSDYLDRILRVLEASGSDMNDLYGHMQDNVDTAQKTGSTDLTLGTDLLKELSGAVEAERKLEADAFSELLSQGNSTAGMEVSPMRVDKEYAALIAKGEGGGYSEEDALMLLWDRYPAMRSYILEKYIAYQNGYDFQE